MKRKLLKISTRAMYIKYSQHFIVASKKPAEGTKNIEPENIQRTDAIPHKELKYATIT